MEELSVYNDGSGTLIKEGIEDPRGAMDCEKAVGLMGWRTQK